MTILKGQSITLRPITSSDVNETYVRWLNDPEVNRYMETRHHEQTNATIRKYIFMLKDTEHLFAIECDGKHIGNIKVGPIKPNHSLADVSLFIGEKDYWGKGLATDAIRTISKFAFEQLGLKKLGATAYIHNWKSVTAFERAGFVIEGTRRNHYILNGNAADIIELGLCAP